MGITADARVLQFASYTFDTSFSDMFATFYHGGCVCVLSEFDRLNDLAGAIRRLNATLACLTPAVVDQLSPADVPSIKTLCVGGEALSESIVERWAPAVALINIYGVTECTIWCMTTQPIQIGDQPSNIGRANCGKTWVVATHDYNELVPIGGVGELLIEGPNLAREYLNDTAKTQEIFINNPTWSIKAGSTRRFYRTGDLVQYCFDGTVNYLGRRDCQVKINGQRVELGEIEYHLKKLLPQHSQLVVDVVMPLTKSGQPRLIAFLKRQNQDHEEPVHKQGRIYPLEPSITQPLSSVLPWYMIPFAVLEICQMPMTISGKLDRKILRHQAASMLAVYNGNNDDSSTDIPDLQASETVSTLMESRLRALWTIVLSINALVIGKQSNFLQLGGDSVAAMKLTTLARQNSLKLTVSDILSRPVLCELATVVRSTIGHVDSEGFAPFALLKNPSSLNEIQSLVGKPIEDSYPCTPIQEGLMALSLRFPGAYIAQAVVKLPAGTDLDRYVSVWKAVVNRNAILRTVMIESSEGLLQVVLEENSQFYRCENLDIYLGEDSIRPMLLGNELSRFGFASDARGDFLVWTAHHSVYDGYSSELIFEQVNMQYSQFSSASPPPYNRFIQHLIGSENEISQEFWRRYLRESSSAPFPFNRSVNYQAHATKSFQQSITFGKPQASNVTTASLLRASWLMLVARYCATDDVVTGATLSGRNSPVPGVELITGPTITTVPIRARFKVDEPVHDFLVRVQQESTAMIPHENFGLRRIRQLGSEAQAACEFQTHLVIHPYVENTPKPSYDNLHGEQSKNLVIGLSTYALTLEAQMVPGGAQLSLRYDERIFDILEISRFVYQLQNLITQLATANNRILLSALDFIGPADELVLSHWQSSPVQYFNECVHHEIMRRMAEFPCSPAVQAWDGNLTYAELDELSSSLAWHLSEEWNVVPEMKVPLLFEKSFWTIVAVVGVMKAGGAFVPLDPSHPQERLEAILEDLGATMILSSTMQAKQAGRMALPVLPVDYHLFQNIPRGLQSPETTVQPSNALYVVYSSGTTGRPKGSVIEHRAYISGALAHRHEYAINSNSRVFQFSSHSFDTCLADFLTTLIVGGCLCIPSQYERENDLVGSINRLEANWAHITPSVANMMSPEDIPCLKTLLLGGEQMTESHISKWKDHLNLINVFGPSECCVTCCANVCPGENQALARNIGLPVGCHAWIVDPRDSSALAPIGALGELLIEGPLVARGYLNEPKKTIASFIPKPDWALEYGTSLPGTSLYRTGDLVRYASNGTLIYEGRRDSQIKLNGQRVELGEIEHILRLLLPTSAVAVDVVSIFREGKQLLAAFIDYKSEERNLILGFDKPQNNLFEDVVFTGALKSSLEHSLPRFMVPSVFLPIHHIPITMSGKVDRQKLKSIAKEIGPRYAFSQTSSSTAICAPSSQIESDLIEICCHILDVDLSKIGTNHSFLELGGDSVDVMRLVALCRRRNIELSVADVFNQPKIADMALLTRSVTDRVLRVTPFSLVQFDMPVEVLLQHAANECHTSLSKIENIYPCTPLQTGITALSLKNPGQFMSQSVWQLPSTIERAAFQAAWESVRESLPILRTSIIYFEGALVQVVRSEGLQWQEASNLQSYLTRDQNCPMELGDPLSRFAMVHDSDSAMDYFVLTVHHAVYDGWSTRLILDEVERVYHGSRPGSRPGFDLFLQHLAQQDLNESEEFWHSQLEGCTAQVFPQLPSIDHQPHPRRNFQQYIDLKRQRADDITLSTMIRATWALLLSQYTNQNDVLFGVTVTGRNAPVPGIEDIVGPTFATVPIRVQVNKDLQVQDYLHRVQSQSTGMIPHEQFGLLNIQAVAVENSASCQFQSLLIVQPAKLRTGATNSSGGFLGLREEKEDVSKFNNYSIMVECRLHDEAITVDVNYDDLVLPSAQMERLIHQFLHVLQQLCLGVVRKIEDIDYISPEDRIELMQWNNASLKPVATTIDEYFQRHVKMQPNAFAVSAWDGEWTYKELHEIAGFLAEHLKTLGVGSGVLVPLCFAKSKWFVAAMMAVLLAGGGCVVLDPVHHPENRLLDISREIGANLVLCDTTSDPIFTSRTNLQTLCLTQTTFDSISKSPLSQILVSKPSDPAFVIFTSGSTGRPKGIVHDHQSICSAIEPFSSSLQVGKRSRILQWSAYAFDVAVIDTMAAILHGACLCIPSEETRINNIARAVIELRANWATFTPSFARHIDPKTVPQLQTVVLAGEAMLLVDVKQWNGRALFNGYGPAEASLCVSGQMTTEQKTITIGRPMASNAWIAQTNNYMKLAPIGAIGQLIMEGPMIATGYLHQPELSNKSFIQVPDWIPSQAKSARAYKTDDLARYHADGSIEFLGRGDSQAKIRGQRFELEEVENAIRMHVKSMGANLDVAAEVVKPKDDGSMPQLVVFVSSAKLETREAVLNEYTSLVEALRNFLPEYMIPSALIPVKEVPMTASGKLDRKWLRALGNTMTRAEMNSYSSGAEGIKVKASTTTEKQIALLWSVVINIPESSIGRSDSFVHLGGNSLNAIHAVALAREKGLAMTVSDIFKTGKLSELASLVDTRNSSLELSSLSRPFLMLSGSEKDTAIKSAAQQCNFNEFSVQNIYPCTPLQEGLWSLSISQPGSYISQNVCKLSSGVDIGRLQGALTAMWNRTDILRTRFIEIGCSLMQVVLSEKFCWRIEDNLETYAEEQRSRAVSKGSPANEFALVQEQDGNQKYLVWTAHHAVFDGWSLSLALRHLRAAYNGEELPMIQFSPFIEHLFSQRTSSEEYWKAETSNPFISTYPKLPSITYQPKSCAFSTLCVPIPQGNLNDIMLSTILRAGWALLVAIYAETESVVFGSVLSGRNLNIAGVEQIVGPTFAIVPICLQIDPKESLQEFLHRVQTHAVDMMPHEHFGLQNIAKLSKTAKTACGFQNIFVIQPAETTEESSSDSFGNWIKNGDSADFHTYPLTMQCNLHPGHIELKGGHDERLIDSQQMCRLMHQYEHVLQQLCTSITRACSVEEIEFCSIEDKNELALWNHSTFNRYETCLDSLISQNARESPWKPAVDAWDGTLTYAELETKSDQFCQHLLRIGVKPGMKIPLLFEPSVWMVVAMLAVAKSGAAFTSIDSHCPQGRIEQMVKDLEAEYIVCSAQTHQTANSFATPILLDISTIASMQTLGFLGLPHRSPEDILYIIYTSGSTGRPKGCIIQHGAYATGALAHAAALHLNSSSRVLQFASYAFDASILEILTTLTVGGCICIPSKEDKENNLVQAMQNMNVNWALLTPSLIDIISPQDVPTLQVLVLGGEPIRAANIKTWAEAVWLCNAYGPSEASVVTAVNPGLMVASSASMIGRAVANTSWIVDPKNSNRLTPIGVVGELLIEGPILSAGYLHNDQQTMAAFVEGTSFLGRSPQRRYKTGDLVRYDSDGALHFVRRKDNQAKLRGQRFEPGEIEHILQNHEGIRQCVVTLPRVGQCKGQLSSVVSLDHSIVPPVTIRNELCLISDMSNPGVKKALQEISESLAHQLPAHMIPTIWFVVHQIPLSISGKLDKTAAIDFLGDITTLDIKKAGEVWSFSEAEHCWTPTELQLQRIWSDVLNVPTASIEANSSFLTQGGDSISAMQLVSKCRAAGMPISVQEVLRFRTIKKLAECAQTSTKTSVDIFVLPLERLESEFLLSPIQAMFFEHMPEGNDLFQQGFFLNLQTKVSLSALETAIEMIVSRHSMLRARFHCREDGKWSQRIVSDFRGSFVLIDCIPPKKFSSAILQSRQAINIQRGPLLAAALVDSNDQQRLYLTAHHLVVDLVSWRIIMQELEALLKGYQLQSLNNVHFQGWLEMQHSLSSTQSSSMRALPGSVEPQWKHYWGLSQAENSASDCLERTFRFGRDVTSLLFGSCCENTQLEPLDIMLGSLIYSFQKTFTDRGPASLMNESHGRDIFGAQLDASNLVGWFTRLYPITVQMDDDDTVFDIAKRVRDFRKSLQEMGAGNLSPQYDFPDSQQSVKVLESAEIMFNFTGRFQQLEGKDSLFNQSTMTSEEAGVIPRNYQRFAYFEISADCSDECFEISFQYHKKMRYQDKIAIWIKEYRSCILEAVGQISKPSFQTRASLYPLWTSSQASLARLLTYTLPNMGVKIEDVQDAYPCSPTQLNMLESQSQNLELFFDRISFDIRSSLNEQPISIGDVSRAWTEVAKHHSTLRTIFIDRVSPSEGFVQVLLRNPTFNIFPDTRIADNQIYTLFNTSTAKSRPPHLLSARQEASGTINCDIYVSHAILDGASMPILFEDLSLALRDQLRHKQRPSYQGFISYLAQQSKSASVNYWTQNLSNVRPCHLISTILKPEDRKIGQLHHYSVATPSYNRLINFCSEAGVTSSTLFHAVWALTLRRFINQPDISFSYLVSGRDQPFEDISHLVGPVINQNICTVDIPMDQTFSSTLQKMQERDLASLPHQHVSFREIRKWLDIPAGNLVDTMVNYRKWAKVEREEGKGGVVFENTRGYDPWDASVTVEISDDGNEFVIRLAVWDGLIDEERSHEICREMSKILTSIIAVQ